MARLQRVRDVCGMHAQNEGSCQTEVESPDDQTLMWADSVVAPHLREVARSPAAEQLRAGKHQDEDQDRVGLVEDKCQQCGQPEEPERGMQRGGDPSPIERY